MAWLILGSILAAIALLYLYIRTNDAKLMSLSPEAEAFSPHRLTAEDAYRTAARIAQSPITVDTVLPPPTGRRYIVIGGVSEPFRDVPSRDTGSELLD